MQNSKEDTTPCSKTLVVGIGNQIMGDDGVGVQAISLLRDKLAGRADIDLREMNSVEFFLAEAMMGYRKVILIDSVVTGADDVGRIHEFSLQTLRGHTHISTSHSMSFPAAFNIISRLNPDCAPHSVKIYAVAIAEVNEFSERLSPKVRDALNEIVAAVMEELPTQSFPLPNATRPGKTRG